VLAFIRIEKAARAEVLTIAPPRVQIRADLVLYAQEHVPKVDVDDSVELLLGLPRRQVRLVVPRRRC